MFKRTWNFLDINETFQNQKFLVWVNESKQRAIYIAICTLSSHLNEFTCYCESGIFASGHSLGVFSLAKVYTTIILFPRFEKNLKYIDIKSASCLKIDVFCKKIFKLNLLFFHQNRQFQKFKAFLQSKHHPNIVRLQVFRSQEFAIQFCLSIKQAG